MSGGDRRVCKQINVGNTYVLYHTELGCIASHSMPKIYKQTKTKVVDGFTFTHINNQAETDAHTQTKTKNITYNSCSSVSWRYDP